MNSKLRHAARMYIHKHISITSLIKECKSRQDVIDVKEYIRGFTESDEAANRFINEYNNLRNNK